MLRIIRISTQMSGTREVRACKSDPWGCKGVATSYDKRYRIKQGATARDSWTRGNSRRYIYPTLVVLGCVAILGTAMTMTAKSREPILDYARVSQMIQESQTHKLTRLLSSTCQGEMEKKMISALSVTIMAEAVCKSDEEAKKPCESWR